MYTILKNDSLLRNVVLETGIQKIVNLRNVSAWNVSQIVYFHLRLILNVWTEPLQIFGQISKPLQPFDLKFVQVVVVFDIYYRIKTIEQFLKPKVWFVFKRVFVWYIYL